MKFPVLIVLACCALLAQGTLAFAGSLRMGESIALNTLASNECACQVASPSSRIVDASDADGASTDTSTAPVCAATPGHAVDSRCNGVPAAAAVKSDPAAASTGVRKLHNGIHWQSLLPGVMK